MNKIFIKAELDNCINELRNIGLCFSYEDFIHKRVFKKIKNLKKIEYAEQLFNSLDKEKKVELVEKFFPNKLREIKEQGEFEIFNFWFDSSIGKLKTIIHQNNNKRTLALRTENYEPRIEELIKEAVIFLTNKISKLYGYFFVSTETGWYITDRNLNKDGSYRIKFKDLYSDNFIVY